jgi:hypothetical protein
MRKGSIVSVAFVLLSLPAFGDTAGIPEAFVETSPDGECWIRFVPGKASDASKHGEAFQRGAANPLWGVEWYDRLVFLANDCVSLARVNTSPGSSDDPGIEFYSSGRLVRSVAVRDIVESPDRLVRTTSRIVWLAPEETPAWSSDGRTLTLVTAEGRSLTFDLATGRGEEDR